MYKNMKNKQKKNSSWFAEPFDLNSKNLKCLKKDGGYTYSWKYGTAIELPIEINDKYIDVPITINIYDIKYLPVVQQEYKSADSDGLVYFSISSEVSTQYLVPGIYYCEVLAKREPLGYELVNTILMPANGCVFQVIE